MIAALRLMVTTLGTSLITGLTGNQIFTKLGLYKTETLG